MKKAIAVWLKIGLIAISISAVNASYAVDEANVQAQEQLPSAQADQIVAQQIQVIRAFYDKRLTDLKLLETVWPKTWLADDSNLAKDRERVEADLATELEQQKKITIQNNNLSDAQVAEHKIELLQLNLQWLHLSSAERKALLRELETKNIASRSEQDSQKNIAEAELAQKAIVENTNNLKDELKNTVDEREQRLLTILLQIDNEFSVLNKARKQLGVVQGRFSQVVQDRLKMNSDIGEVLEDSTFTSSTQTFSEYRMQLRTLLDESNNVVWSYSDFLRYYFGADAEPQLGSIASVKIRDNDTEKNRDLVRDIQEKRFLLQTENDLFLSEKNTLIRRIIQWQIQYRESLLLLRGQLIEKVIADNAFVINKTEPVAVEIKTIAASISLWFWKSSYTSSSGEQFRFSTFSHLIKLALLFAFIAWLFVRRRYILLAMKRWCVLQIKIARLQKVSVWLLNILKDLYVFIVLLVLGQVIIEFVASLGFEAVRSITPIFNHIVMFFLLYGLVNYISPLLSQTGQKTFKNTDESKTIETALEFFPKIYLYYWLVTGLVAIVLTQLLSTSLLQFYVLNIVRLITLAALYIYVKRHAAQWRFISQQASASTRWLQLSSKAENTWWEPALLILSGAIGIYRIVWSLLGKRIVQLEMTRSFQAMLSRAILERQYRRNTVSFIEEKSPANYWRAFDFLVPAAQQCYVARSRAEDLLYAAYREWLDTGVPTRVLICGDRGIGKSELIAQLIRQHQIIVNEIHLLSGDNTVNAIVEILSKQLLNSAKYINQEHLINAINQLPASIITLENLEKSLLRKVGGFEAFSFLVDIILRTSKRHMWISTITTYSWIIAKQGVTGANCFTDVIMMDAMTETELQTLIINRHNQFNELNLDFSQLKINNANKKSKDSALEEEKARNLYFRILWNYTKGNPRQALYYWKTSLSWDNNKTMVKLFDVPEQHVLELQQDITLMTLTALIEHNGLSLPALTDVMNGSETIIRRRIEELSPYGIIFSSTDGEVESWHVESFWARAVENYLVKRQFLFRVEN